MAAFREYADHDGLGLAALVKSGEVSAMEVLEAAFAVIDRLNPTLNAVVRSMREQAERDVRAGLADGPFTGVPIVLKDEYISYAGVPNDSSSRLCAGFTRDYDTELVKRYKRAGIMIIAKTNLPELGASVTTEPVLNGRCNNPWNLERTVGGSSGGSGCAVAAGMAPLAYANDGAGSIRIPGSCNGVFGLKPTRARVPTGPDGGEYWNSLVIEHALTRSVRDSAALLDATEGADPGAPYWAPPKARPFLEEVSVDPRPLRIAYTDTPPFDTPVDEACKRAARDTAKLCEALGHHVEEAAPEYDGQALVDAIGRLLAIHLAAGIDDMGRIMGRTPSPEIIERSHWQLAQEGKRYSAVDLLAIQELFTAVSRKVAPFWQKYDVLLTPTLATPPVPHGHITTNDPDWRRYIRRFFAFVPFTPIANVTGNPAMTVPLHLTDDGLPVGSHFIGRFGDEATLFQLAGQLERARPWAGRHPPVSAWS